MTATAGRTPAARTTVTRTTAARTTATRTTATRSRYGSAASRSHREAGADRVTLDAVTSHLPQQWMPAAELADRCGIPERVLVEKFGIRGKHVAGPDEHVSDLAVTAAQRLFAEHDVDPSEVDAVFYFGSTWKDYPVWQAAPRIADRLGCTRAFGLELDYVSCGAPVALRVGRALLLAEPHLRTVLLVAGCRESQLLDYANPRARFALGFGDGAVAALLRRDGTGGELLGFDMHTDGSFSLDVKVLAGGSVEPASCASVAGRRHYLDVADPVGMKARLDPVSLKNFWSVAQGALDRAGASLADVDYLCGIHLKPSMHAALLDCLGLPADRAATYDDTGHMSGVDPLLGLDRALRCGAVRPGQLCLLLAAGTGYTWAAAVLRAGPSSPRP